MNGQPDVELWNLIRRFQSGDAEAIWLFAQNRKIRAIISARISQYRQMFHWLPSEDLDDIECGLLPRIHDIASKFELPEQPNDGRVIAYFNLRLRGEADFLLKKLTGMKQVVDEEQGKTYLKSFTQSADGLEETAQVEREFVDDLIGEIETTRQSEILAAVIQTIQGESDDRTWLKCYVLHMRQMSWNEIAKEIGYQNTDYTWLKENTARFVSRLKHRLLQMGETVSYRICGIYTDASEVAIAILDSSDLKKNIVWSKTYETYDDLDKVEAKLGDIFRQFDITYVTMNEVEVENRAFVIIMRYLSKRESFVETIDLSQFRCLLEAMPSSVNNTTVTDIHRNALTLANVKRAWIDEIASHQRNTDIDRTVSG